MAVWKKRGFWCTRDTKGMLVKFATEQEAIDCNGGLEPLEEVEDASEEKEIYEEEDTGEEEDS